MEMSYDKALIAGKLRRWEKYLLRFHLPAWEEIPDIGLYMEQVVSVMKEYLDYLPPELKEEQIITSSTINNYVRTHIMPEPVKKRYYRVHLAYLLMICTLKQTLSIAMVQRMIPMGISEEEVRAIYEAYAQRHRLSCQYFVEQVRMVSAHILDHESADEMAAPDTKALITSAVIVSGMSKLLAEKLLLLDGRTLEDGGSIDAGE